MPRSMPVVSETTGWGSAIVEYSYVIYARFVVGTCAIIVFHCVCMHKGRKRTSITVCSPYVRSARWVVDGFPYGRDCSSTHSSADVHQTHNQTTDLTATSYTRGFEDVLELPRARAKVRRSPTTSSFVFFSLPDTYLVSRCQQYGVYTHTIIVSVGIDYAWTGRVPSSTSPSSGRWTRDHQ